MLMAKPISVTGRARGVAARLGAWREDETAGRSEAMAAGAMVGATIGAGLTHSLKLPVLRIAIAVVLAGASFKLAGFF